MTDFQLLLAASTAMDLVASGGVLAMLAARRLKTTNPGRLKVKDLLLVACAMMLVFAIKLLFVRLVGCNRFGMMHLIFAAMGVTLPVLGAIVFLLGRFGFPKIGRVRSTRWARALAASTLCVGAVAAYAGMVEPYWLELTRTEVVVDGMGAEDTPITVAVLADLQFSEVTGYEFGAVDLAMSQRPDLIVIAGDVYQGSEEGFERNLPAIRELFGRLHAPGGVYLVEGNVDHLARLKRMIPGTDVRLLRNDIVVAQFNGYELAICGLELSVGSKAAARAMERLIGWEDVDARLLLAHYPDAALAANGLEGTEKIDLLVCGHTHGGQVQIPGIGPLLTLANVPQSVAAGGLNKVGDVRLYVSRGVGSERGQAPLIRFNCRPELAMLTLVGR